ncbi:MAG: YkgJ family cysteine cluster protein [Dehalococcoidia bacterium]|nr:YkgJ family cysteine cluster protein [Dehalococcoidia bacterium]
MLNSKKTEEGKTMLPCFRCGVCCSGYHVQMSLEEARRLAERLGVGWLDFMDDYLDERWPGEDTRVLRQSAGRCIFLDQPADSVFGLCRVHEFKPSSCRAWMSGPDRKECRQGLNRYWNLSIGDDGRIAGLPEDIRCFNTFIDSIAREEH